MRGRGGGGIAFVDSHALDTGRLIGLKPLAGVATEVEEETLADAPNVDAGFSFLNPLRGLSG